jgi:hypothetical protein
MIEKAINIPGYGDGTHIIVDGKNYAFFSGHGLFAFNPHTKEMTLKNKGVNSLSAAKQLLAA